MRVLISGAGIAGTALAYWLAHYGFEATIVEKAPVLRTGGYIIDFWGAGFEVAERMGLAEEIRRSGYAVQEVRVVNDDGKGVAGFPASAFADATGGRFVSVPRGELAALIFKALERKVETIFGDSVEQIEQTDRRVHVTFQSGTRRDFELVAGADGLHSRVRDLAFGPASQFETNLGYHAAAFETQGYRPRDELVYVMYTQVGKQVARFALRDDRTLFLFTFADESGACEAAGIEQQKALLRRRFGGSRWECQRILEVLDSAGALYFDRVSQIRMATWSNGRVILIGDAAFCVSLLAGQGAALAMVAAYVLATELHRARGDPRLAFARYQALFGPFAARKQTAALRFAGVFAPKSATGLFLRNQIMNLLRFRWIANQVMGRDLADRIVLPEP